MILLSDTRSSGSVPSNWYEDLSCRYGVTWDIYEQRAAFQVLGGYGFLERTHFFDHRGFMDII